MKSGREAITIAYNEREEVEPGVWENKLTTMKVRAQSERVFQSRRDRALADGLVITARFRIRENLSGKTLDYVGWRERKYKVSSMSVDTIEHYTIIEIGELV
jgi:hypothetical protein